MDNVYDYMAFVVQVIRDDVRLREAFNKILGAGLGDQRVPMLLAELEADGAPESVRKFVLLLRDDRIAETVLREINK